MVGQVNGMLIIRNLSVDKDGAVNPALVMQQSRWRRGIRRICSVDKETLISLISGACGSDNWSQPAIYNISTNIVLP